MAAIEPIKGAIRGKKAEAAVIADDDTRGAIRDFDDVSLGRLGLGHAYSIAEQRRSCLIVGCFGLVEAINNRRRSPPRRSDAACGFACRTSSCGGYVSFAVTLDNTNIAHQYPAEPRNGQ
ncbi:hypothetical protein [Bradyrhizobium sp. USDA 4454]